MTIIVIENFTRFTIVLVLLCQTFISCSPPPKVNFLDPLSVSENIYVDYDEFEKTALFQGPRIKPNYEDFHLIRAYKFDDESFPTLYQIYISTKYSAADWRFYDSAYDSNGNNLDMMVITRDFDVGSGARVNFKEEFVLNVSKEYLENYDDVHRNLMIKYSCKDPMWDKVIRIPGGYIKAILNISNFVEQ